MLDGGLGKWKEFGLPLEAGSPTEIAKGNFKVKKFRKELVVDMNSIREYLDKKHYQIVDARSLQRYVVAFALSALILLCTDSKVKAKSDQD